MKFTYKPVCFFIFIMFFIERGYSQNNKVNELLSIKAYVFGKTSSFCLKDCDHKFLSTVTVTNNQDTAVSFWIMTESWPIANWKTNNDSVEMGFLGADANSPVLISIKPHHSANFYCFFQSKSVKKAIEFKLGFLYFPGPPYLSDKDKSKVIVFWSDVIKLDEDLPLYRVEY